MIAGDNGAYLGLLSFLSFGLSVIAAVLAIDMYTLLRTGEFGKSWRVLITASVMFALVQALRMAEHLEWKFADYGLSQIVELMFVMALAYAFFLQRHAFARAAALRGERDETDRDETDDEAGDGVVAANDATEDDAHSRARLHALTEVDAGVSTDEDSAAPRYRGDPNPEHDPDIEWGTPPARESQYSAAAATAATTAEPR